MASPQKRVLLIVAVLVLTASGVFTALAAAAATLSVSPSVVSAGVGTNTSVQLEIASLENVQGADVRFSFDPSVIQVVDADGVAAGVQVSPGDCPAPDFVILNTVDNTAGTGRYAAVEFITNCTAGDVFSITISCIAGGSSPITITEAEVSDPNGVLIENTVFDGTVNCLGNTVFLPLVVRSP